MTKREEAEVHFGTRMKRTKTYGEKNHVLETKPETD